jgi:hypothetical protein
MSWSFSFEADADDVLSVGHGAIMRSTFPADQCESAPDAIQRALYAAYSLTRAVLPGGGGRVHVSLGGHANPGHLPTSGWANDAITVSVTQLEVAEDGEV